MNFSFFPTPTEYLQKNINNEDFIRILENKDIHTNDVGKLIVHKVSRRYTKGFKFLQERLQLFRSQYKINSTMDVNLINKLKLDISSNNENQENSIHPLQYQKKSKLLYSSTKKVESDNFILEKEKRKSNYENLINNIKRNSFQCLHGPNEIFDKNK